jgi:hypothetical protein
MKGKRWPQALGGLVAFFVVVWLALFVLLTPEQLLTLFENVYSRAAYYMHQF